VGHAVPQSVQQSPRCLRVSWQRKDVVDRALRSGYPAVHPL
jgi:hypothetical protein